MPTRTIALVVILVGSSTPALAQSDAWGRHGYVSVAGLHQSSWIRFDSHSTMRIYAEDGSIAAAHEVRPAIGFDLAAGGRLKGRLGLGYAVTYFRRRDAASVTAQVPHPFFFDRPRTVSGVAEGIEHEERAVHLHAMWLVPLSARVQAAVFAGPSYIRVEQDLVSGMDYSESYPFEQTSFVGVQKSRAKAGRFGYNVGVDLSVFFTEWLGLGTTVRYSRADVALASPAGDGTIDVQAGGLQSAAGLRLRF